MVLIVCPYQKHTDTGICGLSITPSQLHIKTPPQFPVISKTNQTLSSSKDLNFQVQKNLSTELSFFVFVFIVICHFISKADIYFSVMSGLVDMLTAEMAKLREKGQALWSNGTGSSNGASIEAVAVLAKGGNGNSTRPGSIFGRLSQVNSAVALCSEASVSMIVECVSP